MHRQFDPDATRKPSQFQENFMEVLRKVTVLHLQYKGGLELLNEVQLLQTLKRKMEMR